MSEPRHEVYIEMNQVGSGLEVRAVDSGDGLEVSFIAPVSASRADIEKLAIAKLDYVRRKSSGKTKDDRGGSSGDGGGGVLA